MFGSIGPTELILIFIIALLVFGPKKLPDVGKSVGKAIREFKKASDEIKGRIEEEIQASEIKDVHKDIQSGMNSLRDGIRDIASVTGVTELKKEIASATDLNAPPSPPPASQVPVPDPYAQPDPGKPETASAVDPALSPPAETGAPVAGTAPGTSEATEPPAAAPIPGQKHAQGASSLATRPPAKSKGPASLAKSSGGRKPPPLAKSSGPGKPRKRPKLRELHKSGRSR